MPGPLFPCEIPSSPGVRGLDLRHSGDGGECLAQEGVSQGSAGHARSSFSTCRPLPAALFRLALRPCPLAARLAPSWRGLAAHG